MFTSNNMAKFFNKSICNGNKEGVPYETLGLNDKFLIYSFDDSIKFFEKN